MITISTQHSAERAAGALSATLTKLNSGTAGASVSLYATVRPANGAAAGGAALTTLVLPKPAGAIANGILTLGAAPDALIMETGIAAWARFSVEGVPLFDCNVSDTSGTATLRLVTTQLYAGGSVRLASGILG